MAKSTPEPSEVTLSALLKPFATLFKEVGMAGFLVITAVGLFVAFSTPDQKKRFIDRFFLMEPDATTPFSISYVIILLITFIVISGYFHRKTIKRLQEEINRLSEFKSEYQAKTTGHELRSSK